MTPSVPGQRDGPGSPQVRRAAAAPAVGRARPAGAALAWAPRRPGLMAPSAVAGAQLPPRRLMALARGGGLVPVAVAGPERAAGPLVGPARFHRASPTTPSRSRPSRLVARLSRVGSR